MKWKSILLVIFVTFIPHITFGQKTGKKSPETITITGKVLTQIGQPVAGAVFYIDNIRTTNITKSDGSYKVKVSTSVLNLEVRSSEFGSCKTPINEQTTINFTLNGDNSQASIPGDTGKGVGVTDNDNKSAKSKAKKMNTYNDIYQMIRGEVSGVVVSGKSIQIQQGHSFFGSSTPLFVVNGIIVYSIDNINPLDVRSIKVLKGSAAAIYGVQGANGVISIALINGSEKEK
ncbi:MAG: TonB-dependent receptor plug domain-containing protein [Bacteroidota bacterium]